MVYVIMGVSGCGKTSVGQELAAGLGVPFYDADAFHPSENVVKMKNGTPLTDADRAPWLASLAAHITEWNRGGDAVLSEPVGHCPKCRRDFFPAAAGVED